MSDLAPLVAAVIRDRVVIEMEQELQSLRNKSQTVEVYDSWDDKVYFSGLLEESFLVSAAHTNGDSYLEVYLQPTSEPCHLERDLFKLSFRIGGAHTIRLQDIFVQVPTTSEVRHLPATNDSTRRHVQFLAPDK